VPTEEPAAAPTPEYVGTPTTPDQVSRITVEELKSLMDSGAKVAILDVRPRESYDMGHIKGAVSFPWKPQLTFADVEMLPWGDLIVTYCDCGPGEADSANVAFQLIELGSEMEFQVLAHPAIEGWIELGYPTE
jgi:rhodanese-related sulfurtransferase